MEDDIKCHTEICPVCKGTGIYKHYRDYFEMTSGICYLEQTCHGCGGKGWIVVPELRRYGINV